MQPTDHKSTPARENERTNMRDVHNPRQSVAEHRTLGVLVTAEENLRGAVPARGHVVSHDWRSLALVLLQAGTGQAKVGNLHQTVAVEQQIGWLSVSKAIRISESVYLDVSVNDFASVHVQDGLEQLVHDVALVNVFQDVRLDDVIQIGFWQ